MTCHMMFKMNTMFWNFDLYIKKNKKQKTKRNKRIFVFLQKAR